jgi:hypothetical protein
MRPAFEWLWRQAGKIALLAALALPAVLAYLQAGVTSTENRKLAPFPAAPHSWAAFLAVPAQLDAWVDDHFGMRAELVRLHTRLRYAVFGEFPTIQMIAGQHDRLFLAAHGLKLRPYSALTNVCIGSTESEAPFVDYLNTLFDDFHRAGLDPKLLLVPSSPVVHSADVPPWLVDDCARDITPMARALAGSELSEAARASILYPLVAMRQIGARSVLFPTASFHWNGPGLDEVARLSLTRLWGKTPPQLAPLPTRTTVESSDVSWLFPGIETSNPVTRPDLDAAQIEHCYGAGCFPELGDITEKLTDTSRFHNPAAPKRRLLIVSDSFGSKISGWYAAYYGTVEHVCTNGINGLNDAQVERLVRFLFRQRADTDILFLYHDGGIVPGSIRKSLMRLHGSGRLLAAGTPY